MAQLSYRRQRFPAEIIQLYLRFTLSYRDVEERLAERGLDVSYETVRRWVLKFGPLIARKLRQGRPRPSARWHLDEMVVRIAGKRMYLWRAVDHEGEVNPWIGFAPLNGLPHKSAHMPRSLAPISVHRREKKPGLHRLAAGGNR